MLRKIVYLLASLCVIAMPLIVNHLFLWGSYNATLLDAVPFWSDELYHWHQSATFSVAGFEGGYYTLDEVTPRWDIFRFYVWGPFSYPIYGSIGALAGFGLASYALINAIAFAFATALFIIITRPNWRQLALLAALLGSFVPLLLYLPSTMQQVLFLAIATILAAGFYQVITESLQRRHVVFFAIFIACAALLRPTWALLLLPLFALSRQKRGVRQLVEVGVVTVPLVLFLAVIFFFSAGDYPLYRSSFFDGGAGGWLSNVQGLIDYFSFNLSIIFTAGSTVAIAQRLQIYVLLLLLFGSGAFFLWRELQGDSKHRKRLWEIAFHLYNLGGLALLSMTLHEIVDGRDYRVMAPHLLLSLLLLIALKRWWLSVVMVVAMLALYVPVLDNNALDQYHEWTQPRYNGIVREQYAGWQPLLDEALSYDPNAENAWCNTLISSFYYVIPYAGDAGLIVAVPPGIGLSWAYTWVSEDFPTPERFRVPEQFKSRWLMLTDDDASAWQERLNVREMRRVQNGALYENLDADCGVE